MYMFGVVGETHAQDYFEVISFHNSIFRFLILETILYIYIYIKEKRAFLLKKKIVKTSLFIKIILMREYALSSK